jgi:hypothetical protein
MSNVAASWLLDSGFPRAAYPNIDVVQVDGYARVPGPAGLREARALARTLVTCNRNFLGPCDLRLDHHGIVVLSTMPVDEPEVERNLLHLEFRIKQYAGAVRLTGNRFLLTPDRAVYRILPSGAQVDLEPWKAVRARPVLAPAG